jgi:hypothetical protein
MENLSQKCTKYKLELLELTLFTEQKAALEQELVNAKTLLEKKELDFKDTIHSLERKVLQDKNRMKREMLQKLNEAVASFRRVADQQMAETTKRAIRENMAIAAQLKKMSSQIIDLIAENQILTTNVTKLTMNNSLLVESEHELVKRNIANQKIVKMLADKLNESYEMLEFSTESPHHLETHVEQPDQEYDHLNRAYLTTDMREEMKHLQGDYNLLAARISQIANVSNEMNLLLEEYDVETNSLTDIGEFAEDLAVNLKAISVRFNFVLPEDLKL